MPVSRRLSEVIEETIGTMEAQGLAASSIRSARQTFDHLLGEVGNIQMKYLDARKIDTFFLNRQQRGESYNTLNLRRNWIRRLVSLAQLRRYIAHDPVAHIRSFRGLPKRRLLIPASAFPSLLDAAEDPADRIAVALGIYQFHRAGEIATLRVGDVDLEHATLRKTNHKVREEDDLPISLELHNELVRWFAAYRADQDVLILDPSWYLVPRRNRIMPSRLPGGEYVMRYSGTGHYNPNRGLSHPEKPIQRVLAAAGYDLRDGGGDSMREGGHTLRRSGARALYDRLLEERGHDSTNRIVQSMLGHKSFATTERYLGLDLDKAKRNTLIAGKPMFPEQGDGATVVALHS